ncbi:TetR family transcriptional regulator [Subtercola sp. Z020]|uniref:TetR/AcrR family transcriptional regulator n=1 Tax=Subtercola sp. Z020 TaxID=2080582 RepID=UPI000CE88B93|nr:TetR/AcrR family transcriptional regulator [Subtercola sp. Z020]PPF87895.1 TetR family transcriptional regulator [Subtercola sp. Z020]
MSGEQGDAALDAAPNAAADGAGAAADTPAPRTTYRHGDLRGALLAAGIEMARRGGPDAVVLREATRQAGVTPNAAYRHFADRQALLRAVSDAAQGLAADAMEAEVARAAAASGVNTADAARRMLRAVGTGYLAFARDEPGLFRAAFSVPDHLANSMDAAKAGTAGRTPFQILSAALDAWAAAGILPPARRANAELYAWSAVHGLGMLVIDGPLRGLSAELVDGATVRVLDMVERGL